MPGSIQSSDETGGLKTEEKRAQAARGGDKSVLGRSRHFDLCSTLNRLERGNSVCGLTKTIQYTRITRG